MKWRTIGLNTIESDSGYTVLRCTSDGVPTGRFVAFAGRTVVVGGYDSREEAQKACEQHLYTIQRSVA